MQKQKKTFTRALATSLGKYSIAEAGNITRVAAKLYDGSDFKKVVHKNSEVNKKKKREFYEENPRARLNMKALHIAERPLRNDIYEMEQYDAEDISWFN